MKKNIFIFSFIALFFIGLVFASKIKSSEVFASAEKSMPSAAEIKENPQALETWKEEMKTYLEDNYNQKIIAVNEDKEKISFVFETDSKDKGKPQFEMITYYFSESIK